MVQKRCRETIAPSWFSTGRNLETEKCVAIQVTLTFLQNPKILQYSKNELLIIQHIVFCSMVDCTCMAHIKHNLLDNFFGMVAVETPKLEPSCTAFTGHASA